MNLLIDSHILLWYGIGHRRLKAHIREQIEATATSVAVSLVSAWELEIKCGLGQLTLDEPLEDLVLRHGFVPLGITFAHTAEAGALPRHHGDPFDRMLVAQARVENLTLVTADRRLEPYDVKVMWA